MKKDECCKHCGQPMQEAPEKEAPSDMKSSILDSLLGALEGEDIGEKIQIIVKTKGEA